MRGVDAPCCAGALRCSSACGMHNPVAAFAAMARDVCNRRTSAARLCTRLTRGSARDLVAGGVLSTACAMSCTAAGACHTRGEDVAEAPVDHVSSVRSHHREPGRSLCCGTPSLWVGVETRAHGHDRGGQRYREPTQRL